MDYKQLKAVCTGGKPVVETWSLWTLDANYYTMGKIH
jgi:hypothetical protein